MRVNTPEACARSRKRKIELKASVKRAKANYVRRDKEYEYECDNIVLL